MTNFKRDSYAIKLKNKQLNNDSISGTKNSFKRQLDLFTTNDFQTKVFESHLKNKNT